jgi:hypothetical protein
LQSWKKLDLGFYPDKILRMTNTTATRAYLYSDREDRTDYLVLMAHAGRRQNTGAKSHLALVSVWKESGHVSRADAYCGGNLSGTIIKDGRELTTATCKKCQTFNLAKFNAESVLINL